MIENYPELHKSVGCMEPKDAIERIPEFVRNTTNLIKDVSPHDKKPSLMVHFLRE